MRGLMARRNAEVGAVQAAGARANTIAPGHIPESVRMV